MGRASVTGATRGKFGLLRALLGALLLTCVLAPWAYEIVLRTWDEPIPPFRRVFDRVVMIVLLVMIVLERKNIDLGQVRAYLSREQFSGGAKSFFSGLGVSVLCTAAVAPLILTYPGVSRTGMGGAALFSRFATDFPGAVLVGFIEECLFRVMVLEAMRRAFSTAVAIASTTIFYAVVHFLQPAKDFVYQTDPLAGVHYLWAVAQRALAFDFLLPLVGLVLVGVVLAIAIVRTGSLWLCIGLHAGWFLVHKLGIRGLEFDTGAVPVMDATRWHLLANPWSWLSIALVGMIVLVVPRTSRARARPRETQSARDDSGSSSLGIS